MNRDIAVFGMFILSLCPCSQMMAQKPEVEYVNSYVGTSINGWGALQPIVGTPFAMTNFTAQTRENYISQMGYYYEDTTVIGFKATHQPSVWVGDYGDVSVMPVIGSLRVKPSDRAMFRNHDDEMASPYLYKVNMHDAHSREVTVEMSASSRCGILVVDYPKGVPSYMVVQALNVDDRNNLPHWAQTINSQKSRLSKVEAYVRIDRALREITGYNPDHMEYDNAQPIPNFKGYFVVQFDTELDSVGTWNNATIFPDLEELYGKIRMGAYVSFKHNKNRRVKVKIGTSFISIEQARENLQREIPHWDLNSVSQSAKSQWQANLSRIKVSGVDEDRKSVFYTAMYHSLLYPREFDEYGRYYSGYDDRIHNGISYTDFSLWDTFRAQHPLLLFIQPERVDGIITSMLQMYQQGGRLPEWPNPMETNVMIGSHADPVIADAFVKGFKGYDVDLAYQAMRKNAMVPPVHDTNTDYHDLQPWDEVGFEARAGLSYYHSIGYVPVDRTAESVSRHMEYGLDDYCVAQVAKALGHEDDYRKLMAWSKSYVNLYNKESGFIAPRLYNGDWCRDVNAGFTEGSPWTYLFCVMQDVDGMIEMMGGAKAFSKKLDDNFEGGHYVHANEPGHHYIFLYDYCGEPWKTQALVREQSELNYKNLPDGLCGNDDLGQMSAWYIFAVMGFYPVTSASGEYAIGAPQFPELKMQYKTGSGEPCELHIIAHNISKQNKYIQSVTLDGVALKRPFVTHDQIVACRKMEFTMGDRPNYNWK